MTEIAVIDYGIGNLRSAEKALQHLGADARLTGDADEIARARAVVLPGVGAFGACMHALRASGLEGVCKDALTDGRPFLGICIGMQMLFEGSDESPDVPGLGAIVGRVTRDCHRSVGTRSKSRRARDCARNCPIPPGCTSCTRMRRSPPTTQLSPHGRNTDDDLWPRSNAAPYGPHNFTPRSRARSGCD
jgi:hypothetical protein